MCGCAKAMACNHLYTHSMHTHLAWLPWVCATRQLFGKEPLSQHQGCGRVPTANHVRSSPRMSLGFQVALVPSHPYANPLGWLNSSVLACCFPWKTLEHPLGWLVWGVFAEWCPWQTLEQRGDLGFVGSMTDLLHLNGACFSLNFECAVLHSMHALQVFAHCAHCAQL